jgi:hypothetical protein
MSRFYQRVRQRLNSPEYASGFAQASDELLNLPTFSTEAVAITTNVTAGLRYEAPSISVDPLEGIFIISSTNSKAAAA